MGPQKKTQTLGLGLWASDCGWERSASLAWPVSYAGGQGTQDEEHLMLAPGASTH